MLLEFAATNFRSIKEKQTFSMMPAGKIKLDEHSENIIPGDNNRYNISLLKSSLFKLDSRIEASRRDSTGKK